MNLRRETAEMDVPPGKPQGLVPEAYLKGTSQGSEARGRPEGRPYQRSQQEIDDISGLKKEKRWQSIGS